MDEQKKEFDHYGHNWREYMITTHTKRKLVDILVRVMTNKYPEAKRVHDFIVWYLQSRFVFTHHPLPPPEEGNEEGNEVVSFIDINTDEHFSFEDVYGMFLKSRINEI